MSKEIFNALNNVIQVVVLNVMDFKDFMSVLFYGSLQCHIF